MGCSDLHQSGKREEFFLTRREQKEGILEEGRVWLEIDGFQVS